MRPWLLALLLAAALTGAVVAADAQTGGKPAPQHSARRELHYQGHGVRWWAHRAVLARRDANHYRHLAENQRVRVVTSVEPIYEHAAVLAAIAYGVDADTLIRKGRCESVNWTAFHNDSGASGPWQFLPSTWATTPFASYSSYDPFAAALAAAWMHMRGRGGEWVCQ